MRHLRGQKMGVYGTEMQYNRVQCSTYRKAQFSTAQHSEVQYRAVQYCSVRHCALTHNTTERRVTMGLSSMPRKGLGSTHSRIAILFDTAHYSTTQ